MKNFEKNTKIFKLPLLSAVLLLGAGCLMSAPSASFADGDTYTIAPPIGTDAGAVSADPTDSTPASSTVFNWQEAPVNQKVPLTRAVFDQGGYQLFDTVGETILVPFQNDNLYVMKFAVSPDDTMYYENTGSVPVLYVPQDGYLENATVPGAKWYPFTTDFDPSGPVYLSVAPSWDDYVDVGWYPDMCCYGGYWCDTTVGVFTPSVGLCISFGGNNFFGWGQYRTFCNAYPAPYFVGYFHRGVYGYGNRRFWGDRSFQGHETGAFSGRTFGNDGHGGFDSSRASNNGRAPNRYGSPSESVRSFRGASGAWGDTGRGDSEGYVNQQGSHSNWTGDNESNRAQSYGNSGGVWGSDRSNNAGSAFRGGSSYGYDRANTSPDQNPVRSYGNDRTSDTRSGFQGGRFGGWNRSYSSSGQSPTNSGSSDTRSGGGSVSSDSNYWHGGSR